MPFSDLHLSDLLLDAVRDAGYEEPTAIQAAAIPSVLMGHDLIGVAQTGTGKTASFVLPMIDVLAEGRSRARMPRSLILEPTRELATQVAENFETYGKNHHLAMVLLIGGVAFGEQDRGLAKGADVLIATPGRLIDQYERGKILLSGVDMLVIDEADRMLDMGFIPDIERICTLLNPTRQTLLFSATMPPPIKKLADRFMRDPRLVEVARPATTNKNIEQMLVPVDQRHKRATLRALLKEAGDYTAIVFANRKTTVRDLARSLAQDGYAVGQIHGNMTQPDRLKELERFRAGDINILVASDVASRGLDIKGVSHIFNFDAPWHPDDYVHRVGRTGRAGAKGIAYTFMTSEDAEAIERIEKLTGQKIARVASPATGRRPHPEAEQKETAEEKASAERRGRTAEPKPRPHRDPRREAQREPRPEPRHDARPEPRHEPRRDARSEPRHEGREERENRGQREETRPPRRAPLPPRPPLAEPADEGPADFGDFGPPAFLLVAATPEKTVKPAPKAAAKKPARRKATPAAKKTATPAKEPLAKETPAEKPLTTEALAAEPLAAEPQAAEPQARGSTDDV